MTTKPSTRTRATQRLEDASCSSELQAGNEGRAHETASDEVVNDGSASADISEPTAPEAPTSKRGSRVRAARQQTSVAAGPSLKKAGTKQDLILARLRSARGAPIAKLIEMTGWQNHTVRGFLSAVVRKKLGLSLISEAGKDGERRYRIVEAGK